MSLVLDHPFIIESSGIDPGVFKGAMAAMPSAVTIVTTFDAEGNPTGATLSAVSSLSLSPALMLACFDNRSDTLKAVKATRRFLIHVLADGQQQLALAFARKGAGKFEGIGWAEGPLGLPLLEGSAVTVACRLFQVVPGGDHAMVLGEIADIKIDSRRRPLVYAHRQLVPLRLKRAKP